MWHVTLGCLIVYSSSVEVSSQQAEVVAAATTIAAAATVFPSAASPASSIKVVHGSLVQFKVSLN